MSYTLDGYKWGASDYGTPSGTIYWNASIVTGLSYNTELYTQNDFDLALFEAFQDWEDISGIDFEHTADASAADVDVSMTYLADAVVGQMIVYYETASPLNTVINADIWFDDSETWSPYGETDLSFFAVALHEIGHVIGLNHVDDTTEIMNSYVSANSLGDGDILGAQILYGDAEGNVVEAPEPEVTASSGSMGMGILAIILGAILALLGMGPGGFLAAAVVARDDEDPLEPAEDADETLLTDLIPSTGTLGEVMHQFYKYEQDDHHHDDEHEEDLLAVI